MWSRRAAIRATALAALAVTASCASEPIYQRTVPPPASPGTTAPPGQVAGPPPMAGVFVRGEVLRGPAAQPQGKVPFEDAPQRPPVSHGGRVAVEVGRTGDLLEVWLMLPDGVAVSLGEGGGAAFAADGSQLAVTRHEATGAAQFGTSTLLLFGTDGELALTGPTVEGYARTAGWVGDRVLVEVGDGASVGVVMWDPGEATLIDLEPGEVDVRGVLATHAASGRALLRTGDGPCWVLADLLDGVVLGPGGCGTAGRPVFSPSGAMLAMLVDAGSLEGPAVSVLRSDDAEEVGRSDLAGVVQVVWESEETLVILSERSGRTYEATRCDLTLTECRTAWRASLGPSGTTLHPVWLIEEQR